MQSNSGKLSQTVANDSLDVANNSLELSSQNLPETVGFQHGSGAANDRDGFPSNGAMAFATTHGATTTTSAAAFS